MSAPCKTCKFAEWEKTATGRLSPKGKGRCLWRKEVRLAASCQFSDCDDPMRPLVLQGRFIWRNTADFLRCPVYERVGQ